MEVSIKSQITDKNLIKMNQEFCFPKHDPFSYSRLLSLGRTFEFSLCFYKTHSITKYSFTNKNYITLNVEAVKR